MGEEFGVQKPTRIQLGNRFRTERKSLVDILNREKDEKSPVAPAFAVFHQRSRRSAGAIEELTELASAGRLTRTLPDLAISFIHMFVNRLFWSAQRPQELVLYDFLDRLYESQAARAKKALVKT